MRPYARITALLLLGITVTLASAASADQLLFNGELGIRFSHNGVIKEVKAQGTGVATVNGSGGGSGALNTLQLTRPFAEINEDVLLTSPEIHFDGVRINPLLKGPNGAPGVFKPIFGAAKNMTPLTLSTLPAAGTIVLCNLSGCPESVPMKLNQTFMGVAVGPGVGGTLMAKGPGITQVTVTGTPWTINTTTASYRASFSMGGGISTFMDKGFVRGPNMMTGTTLGSMGIGGQVQLVSATQTQCAGCTGSNDVSGQISRLTLTFAPEPGLLLLLGAGAFGVALLGRKRIRH